MVKKIVKIFVVGILLASVAGAESYGRVFSAETAFPLQEALKQDDPVKEIYGYRQWANRNPKPWLVESPTEMG
jgi:hypothetical protein